MRQRNVISVISDYGLVAHYNSHSSIRQEPVALLNRIFSKELKSACKKVFKFCTWVWLARTVSPPLPDRPAEPHSDYTCEINQFGHGTDRLMRVRPETPPQNNHPVNKSVTWSLWRHINQGLVLKIWIIQWIHSQTKSILKMDRISET